MTPSQPFALRVFVPSGIPEGLRIVEKSNWSGIGFVVPRSQLAEFIARPEAQLIELAREARRCKLDNLQQGRSISLSEVDRAEAEGYLSELLLCCPVLGLRLFERPQAPSPTSTSSAALGPASAPTLFHLRGPDSIGQGYESPGGFTVLEGARARLAFVESSPDSVVAIRQQLTEQGVFAVDGQGLILSQSYEFNSPSQAAVMLLARSANGLIEWKDAGGLSLREHRQRQVPIGEEVSNG
jgi:hypothetical protein